MDLIYFSFISMSQEVEAQIVSSRNEGQSGWDSNRFYLGEEGVQFERTNFDLRAKQLTVTSAGQNVK